MKYTYNRGIGLLEVVVAVAIIGVALGSVVISYSFYLKAALQNTDVIKATYLAEEGIEAVRILRDTSWTDELETLNFDTDYFLTYATTTKTWSVTENADNNYVDGKYMRTLRLDEVFRDSNNDIVHIGGTEDAETILAEVMVSWSDRGATSTRSLKAYYTDLFSN